MPILATYLHAIDPFAFRFPDWPLVPAGIRWYGLSYLAGFLAAFLLIKRVTRVGRSTVKPAEVADLVVTLALGAVIGGRLGYVIFYEPSLLWRAEPLPLLGVIKIWQGGMSSHGGILGVIAASWLYARRQHHSWAHLLDLAALGTPLGLFFGRIANFVNGELFGRECRPDMPLAVKFPQEMTRWLLDFNDPSAARLEVALRQLPEPFAGPLTHDRVQLLIAAIQRGNARVSAAVEPLLTPRHPSQLYEALLEGLVLLAVLAIIWVRPRKPLIVGGAFALTYGVVRIIGEQFRLPDDAIANQEFAHLGVTRGQLLSVALAISGVVLLIAANRRKAQRLGGWVRVATKPG